MLVSKPGNVNVSDSRTQIADDRTSAETSVGSAVALFGDPTWRLLCSSFLGSILQSLSRKQVRTQKELHRSLQVV